MTERPPGIHHGEPALDPGSPNRTVQHAHEAPYQPPHEPVEFDREIQYHQLIWMGVSLLVLALLSGVLVFFMLRGFVSWRAARAAEPPLVAPPSAVAGPQLLARPERELDEVRRGEQERLTSYGWVDPASGVAHIPIERAIEILAARGLPSRPPAPAGAPAAATAVTGGTATGAGATASGPTHAAPGASTGGAAAGTPGAEPDATPPEVPR
jgi:hypothetical protein